jgi:hypothetical protein
VSLLPETKPPQRSGLDDDAANERFRLLYLRSFLLMRAIIGFIGLTLPVVLIVADHLLGPNAPTVRSSLSSYYYSGTRDYFVGSLFAAGVFLIAYKMFERSLSNLLSVVGGLAAITVTLFPTQRPPGTAAALTPIQQRLGEATVSHVHYTAAGIFIVSLAIITFSFGRQEGRRSQQRPSGRARLSPSFWRWFHWLAGLAILASVGFIVFAEREHFFTSYALLVGETVALVAFGASWLTKGLELDVLLGRSDSTPT